MNRNVLSALLLTFATAAGCADAGPEGDEAIVENESAAITQHLTLRPGTNTNCGQFENPRLQFFGVDSGNVENYTIQGLTLANVNRNGCGITIPIDVPSNFKVRVKSETIVGNSFTTGVGTRGRVEARASLRTRAGGTVSAPVPAISPSPVPGKNLFKNEQFTGSQFTQCPFGGNLETVFVDVRSFVDVGSSIPGQTPGVFADLNPIEISLQVAPCP
jgi:hypothetical protein